MRDKVSKLSGLAKRVFFVTAIVYFQSLVLKGNDSTKYYLSLKLSTDMSDTFGGGEVFSGEVAMLRSWYGLKMDFGHFQSQSIYLFKVPYEEIGKTLEISIPEMSIMKIGSLSGFVRPIDKNWISIDILMGAAYGKSKSFLLKSIDYEYNIEDNTFNYVFKDYSLHKANHFGYQAGIDITFWFNRRFGCQLNSRIQDLNNGGTFFLVGFGLSVKF
jgi:hypothetical protein